MRKLDPVEKDAALVQQASRAQRILYIVMGLLMLLPLVLAWLAGALRV